MAPELGHGLDPTNRDAQKGPNEGSDAPVRGTSNRQALHGRLDHPMNNRHVFCTRIVLLHATQ